MRVKPPMLEYAPMAVIKFVACRAVLVYSTFLPRHLGRRRLSFLRGMICTPSGSLWGAQKLQIAVLDQKYENRQEENFGRVGWRFWMCSHGGNRRGPPPSFSRTLV